MSNPEQSAAPSESELDHKLKTAEARWRAVIDSSVDGIIVIDSRGAIEVFNQAAERMFGYAEHEVAGRNVGLLMPAPHRDDHDRYIRSYLATGERKIIGLGREVRGLRRDGHTFPLHLSVGEMVVGDERHFTAILHDLSRRSELEERLRETTALARLGEMAAVIAHEVKNPLAGVRGAIQVIGYRLPAGSPDAAVVTEIVARLDGLNALINDLLVFARPREPRFTLVDLGILLASVAALLKKDPAFAMVRVEVLGEAPPVPADADLLTIVFQNLFINAAQAMHGQGSIRAMVRADDGWHEVQVADTGPGLAPAAREHLFRAFHTTKARGTGLGLPTARRLLDQHDGTITLACPPSGGTTVTVRLPSTRS